MAHHPTLVLVTGLPGTGKSTIADAAAAELGAAVLGWDWVMAGLRAFPALQEALEAMDATEHRDVGWSMLRSLATAQLRADRSVVLDGVARAPQIRAARACAQDSAARCVVVLNRCPDASLHRRLIEGRQRRIPNWYELEWAQVERARGQWEEPEDVDLVLDAHDPLDQNVARLAAALSAP